MLMVLLALCDVFLTVLYARSGAGLITPRVNKLAWRTLRWMAPRQRHARDGFLSFGGPLILVLTVTTWVGLLLLGFALIAWPALGTSIRSSSGETPTDLAAAISYSGYSLTTLGTGDIVPQTPAFRLMMTAEAIVGFSVLTLTLTYFMSVYSALVRRNTLAQALHHLSCGTGDASEIVVRLGSGGTFEEARTVLADTSFRVLDLLESHHSYPVLHYFRMKDPRYAMARIALLAMDTAAILRTALGERHQGLSRSAAVDMLWGSGMALLEDAGRTFLAADAAPKAAEKVSEDAIRDRYRKISLKLESACIDRAGAAGDLAYRDDRCRWEALVRAFAALMAHDWIEIDPPSADRASYPSR